MAPGKLIRRGAAKTPRREPCSTSTGNGSSRPKRLSRELEGLASWSGWKRNSTQRQRREASDSTETEEGTIGSRSSTEASRSTDTTIQVSLAEEQRAQKRVNVRSDRAEPELRRNTVEQVRSIEVICLDEDSDEGDTITVAASSLEHRSTNKPREAADHSSISSVQDSLESIITIETPLTPPLIDTQSDEDRAARSGPRCPLCICPINSVYFPIIKCTDCERTYHTKCIGFGRPPQYHPFSTMSNPESKRCSGCGCPEGHELTVYCGCPSILFHRRDQDPGFREYFRKGRTEEAKYEDLV